MSKDVSGALAACLQELHLPAVRAQYEAVARQASAESWGYPDYLRELLERECQQRRANRIERLLRGSRLPLEKNWSALDLKRLPAKVVQQLRGLLSGEFVDRRGNVLAFAKWEQIFKDAMTAAAAIDRLVHHSVIIELNLPSYRAEQAKKAKQARGAGAEEAASG